MALEVEVQERAWHSMSANEVMQELGSSMTSGLSAGEAEKRLNQ